ncbi:MAG: serine/threonine-protein kinase [Bacteroidota bacterium]
MDHLTAARWAEIDTLFAQVLDRPADERTAFLRAACGDDPALYHTVAALLDADARAEDALGESATDFAGHLLQEAATAAETAEHLAEGTRVGPYRIEGILGRGGMGTVYRAARADGTFEKAVALKLVKRGIDTDAVLRRFRHERQILAGLDHPHIARLLDAGAAADGRPYLVMEVVDGLRITDYADRHGLDLEARLALFEQVCAAVAYAHRHLVVHRDLKPSNILVAEGENNGPPQAKLLDFGIARLLDSAPDITLTQAGQRILTPEYAAPEQRDGGAVTTATDVYALGVVLFELLVGRRPDGPERLSDAAPVDQRRALRGDLDVLVATAMHPDPARRYASAEALRDDLVRRRTGLPLKAQPDSRAYRLRKFVERHRVGVAATALVAVLTLAAVAALAFQQRQTARALAESEATVAFLEEVFTAVDPYDPVRLDTLRARDLLLRGGARVQTTLADQPALQAGLLTTIGGAFVQMGLYSDAQPLLDDALRLHREHTGASSTALAETQQALGRVARYEGDFEAAEQHYQDALATLRRLQGHQHPRTIQTARDLAELYEETSRPAEAETILRDLAARERRQPTPDTLELALTLNNLAIVLRAHERYDEAEAPAEEAYTLRRAALGDGHPAVAASLGVLGSIYRNQDRLDEAETAYRESLRVIRAALGDDHRDTQVRETHLAELLRDQGKYDESIALYRDVLERTRLTRGDDFFGVAVITSLLANVLLDAGRLADAEAGFRDALDRMGRALPPGHIRIARTTENLALCLQAQERYAEAEPLLLDAYAMYEAADYDASRLIERLGTFYETWGRPSEAARWQARAAEA